MDGVRGSLSLQMKPGCWFQKPKETARVVLAPLPCCACQDVASLSLSPQRPPSYPISFPCSEAGLRLGWELQGLREAAQQLWDRPHS